MLNYGKSFKLWRASCPKEWTAYVEHKFIQMLENGSLPRKAFVHYLRQDYIFLKHFARAWALAIAKADDLEEMRIAASTVNSIINEEMQLHVKVCEEEGISEKELLLSVEQTQNIAYTRYVLEIGYKGTFVDLMAALAPCIMGYGEVGFRLGKNIISPAYQDWILTYSDDGYQNLCSEIGMLIDRAILLRFGDQGHKLPSWHALCKIFLVATRLETDFWEMGLNP